MFEFGFDVNQKRMAAADDERDVRFEVVKARVKRVSFDPGRVKMRLVVMDAKERPA